MASSSHVTTPPAARWTAEAEEAIRAAGHRASAPRTAVLEVIARQPCVLSATDIAHRLREDGREVGVATVYRTLDLLESLGLVQRLDMGDSSARYEPALPDGEHHHHHLICDRCGRVTPFEDADLERVIESLGRRLDHEVVGHDVVLRGLCPSCLRG